jgi:hypothetical protein
MTTRYKLNNGDYTGYDYDYGLRINERFGKQEIAHNGGIHGFATTGIWLPLKQALLPYP